MKGRLKDRSFDALLESLHTREASGVLTVEKKPARRQFCVLKGIVRLAASNVPEERFGEFLATYEALDRETIRAAEQECAANGRRLGEVLMASGAIGLDTLRGWVRYYILEMIFLSEAWTDGEYLFVEGVPNIVGEVTVEIPPLEIALERHRRSIPEAPMKQLTANQPLIVTPSPTRNGDVRRLRLTGAESFVLQRLKGATDLHTILKDTPFEEMDTLRAIGERYRRSVHAADDDRVSFRGRPRRLGLESRPRIPRHGARGPRGSDGEHRVLRQDAFAADGRRLLSDARS
jgi:hypothetical protein